MIAFNLRHWLVQVYSLDFTLDSQLFTVWDIVYIHCLVFIHCLLRWLLFIHCLFFSIFPKFTNYNLKFICSIQLNNSNSLLLSFYLFFKILKDWSINKLNNFNKRILNIHNITLSPNQLKWLHIFSINDSSSHLRSTI